MKPGKRFQIDGEKCVKPKKETNETDNLVNELANGTFLDDLDSWFSTDSVCKIDVIFHAN